MAIVKWRNWNPWWPTELLEDSPLNKFLDWPELSASSGLDIYETEDSVVVEAQVPGVKEEDVNITIEGNVINISAEAKEEEEKKEKKKTVYKSSRQMSFSYSTSLPRMVDSGKATATVENGVVIVNVPKVEEEKPKKIQVMKK